MNRVWSVLLVFLALMAFGTLIIREQPTSAAGGPVNFGDTAWLLTATGLVLLMTPGLSFFYAGMISTKKLAPERQFGHS